ncbi:MAG TPA: ABC transporter permease subunit [Candidatus Dormibacteraeota bacterium]|nr:ABC transporter permease subunit [Candidatus Dormibacteraeota bacterium]
MSLRRIRGIVRKELREYGRNRSTIAGMAILPLVFTVQPLIAVLRFSTAAAGPLAHEHVLLYMLGIPTLVPVVLAATAIAGERAQGTLEPALTTPLRRDEMVLAKWLAALIPSVVVAYAVFGVFLLVVALFAQPAVAPAVFQWPDLVAQVVFTPLLASWSIWIGIGFSTRSSDVRVAQQLGMVASLPPVFAVAAVALGAVAPSVELGVAAAAVLVVLDVAGWRVTSMLFDRERLITGPRS